VKFSYSLIHIIYNEIRGSDNMNFNAEESLCFTGHRPNKLYGYDKLSEGNTKIRNALRDAIIYMYYTHGIRNFISGVALGIDQWAAEIVLELKEKYPDMKLICAIPCKGHSDSWPKESQITYENILDKADMIIYTSNMKYFPTCMHVRDKWMVNKSNYQIAVWNGTKGGTKVTIDYANKVGKDKRIVINPKTMMVKMLGV
jgi:uncharacterized phage-like protein YoqJ